MSKLYKPDDDAWIQSMVDQAIEDAEKSGEALPKVVKLVPDEVRLLWCVNHYDNARKEPGTGRIHAKVAGEILGMMLQCDEKQSLQLMAVQDFGRNLNSCKSVMAALARIACGRKGISFSGHIPTSMN